MQSERLDPYGRGACDVCPGLSSLKVVGTDLRRFTNSPITRDLGVKSKAGAYRIGFRGNIMKKRYFLVSAALTLAGCVSMGTDYDPAAVNRLQKGMTKAQVIGMLGKPNQVISYADGTERLIWVHSTGSMLGAKARSVGLPFGGDGRLTDVPRQPAE